jgi:cell wall-associated NlpC family hydrolase
VLKGRRLTAVIAAVAISTPLLLTTSAQAEPELKDVQAKVDALYLEAEQATEDYNEARIRLKALERQLVSLNADESRQDATLDTVRGQLRDSMLEQFEGSSLSAVGQVVVSDDPQSFLGQLTTISAYDNLQSGLYDEFTTQAAALRLRRDATQRRADEVAKTKARLKATKRQIDGKLAEAEELLQRLKDEERLAILSRGAYRAPSDIDATGRAATALGYALAQLGDAYVWGAMGEDAFDCSGLTMRAWGTAGVSLPHSSRAQYSSGPHVAESDLRPGDLVFYYSPISHVGLYIGNGLIVHAARPGEGVKISDLHSMPYVGAVRPG